MSKYDLFLLDDAVWIHIAPTGIPVYDFDFRAFFPCRNHQLRHPMETVTAVARIGAFEDAAALFTIERNAGADVVIVSHIHSMAQHLRCSRLSHWYPLLKDLTPRSKVYGSAPSLAEVATDFDWPIFMKGERQTSRHQRVLSIIHSADEFNAAMRASQHDRILQWQPIVCREFVPLRPVEDPLPDRIPSSFEFRTFWWKGELVGHGRYWWEGKPYDWTDREKTEGLAMAREAAGRVNVPFLVVDIAQTAEGRWIVIECNDGQESGYAGASPLGIWQNIISIERRLKTDPG